MSASDRRMRQVDGSGNLDEFRAGGSVGGRVGSRVLDIGIRRSNWNQATVLACSQLRQEHRLIEVRRRRDIGRRAKRAGGVRDGGREGQNLAMQRSGQRQQIAIGVGGGGAGDRPIGEVVGHGGDAGAEVHRVDDRRRLMGRCSHLPSVLAAAVPPLPRLTVSSAPPRLIVIDAGRGLIVDRRARATKRSEYCWSVAAVAPAVITP